MRPGIVKPALQSFRLDAEDLIERVGVAGVDLVNFLHAALIWTDVQVKDVPEVSLAVADIAGTMVAQKPEESGGWRGQGVDIAYNRGCVCQIVEISARDFVG